MRRHRLILGVSGLVVVLALLLEVGPAGERVAFRFWPEQPLPHSCISRQALGVECPGCGLTRSFIHLTRLDWLSAWHYHRVGWLMALAVILQFPYRVAALRRESGDVFHTDRVPRYFGILLIAALVGNWAFNTATRFFAG